MKSSDVSEILLIQSIESTDEDGDILHFEERRSANAALEGEGAGSPLEAHSARAKRLLPHVKQRASWLLYTTHTCSEFPTWLTLVCIGFALLSGSSLQLMSGFKTFHILSFSLLGFIFWNVASLLFLIASPYIWKSAPETTEEQAPYLWGHRAFSFLTYILQKWVRWRSPHSKTYTQDVAEQSWSHYWSSWSHYARRLLFAQLKSILHICSIAFGVGVLLSAYTKGLTLAYKATNESTFLQPSQIDFVLHIVLTPSRWILGSLPQTVSSAKGIVGPAAPWIHHYALTLACLVFLPRFVLFVLSQIQVTQLRSRLPLAIEKLRQTPTLNIALASHTNVGKTSLARTLLRRDVGEVRNAEHVTRRRAGYFLIHTPEVALRLWDTPGFGDPQLLAENLRQPDGWSWLKSLRDPKLRFDREAALSLQEEADLILYLIPADSIDPDVEQTLRDEWNVLRQIQRPVICILNRLQGVDLQQERSLIEYWRQFFAREPLCKDVIALDAFTRSLQDEHTLFEAIESAVDTDKKGLAHQCRTVWLQRHEQHQRAASSIVAFTLLHIRQDKEPDTGKEAGVRFQSRAQKYIAEMQEHLLEHMGLKSDIRDRMIEESNTFLQSIIPERGERTIGTIAGAALGGLLTGITTDILAGGLTFFGGAAIGAIAGAVSGMSAGELYKRVGKRGARSLTWGEDFLKGVALRMTLLYLTAASFGRAKGTLTDKDFLDTASQHANSDDSSNTRHQTVLFQAAEKAVHAHWPHIWPLLVDSLELDTSKIWDKTPFSWKANSAWKTEEQEHAQSTQEATSLETSCTTLLEEALVTWQGLREHPELKD